MRKLLIRSLGKVKLGILYKFSLIILYPFVRYILRYRREVVKKNLAFAFPDKSEKEREWLEINFYKNLTDVLIEIIHLASMTVDELKKRLSWTIDPGFKEDCKKNGTICFMGHYANWEWVIAALKLYTDSDVFIIYSPLHNSFVNSEMLRIRERFGGKLIRSDEVTNLIEKRSAKGKDSVFLALSDQLPKEKYVRHFHNFLGIKSKVITGTETLCQRYGFRPYFIEVMKTSKGYYHCNIKSIPQEGNSDWPVTDSYLDMLSSSIKCHPELWLWSHDRWRR